MLLLIFECLYYFLSACLRVLMLSGCLRYAINICIISGHDYVIIRSNYLNKLLSECALSSESLCYSPRVFLWF
jgi:hypothetical protein